MDFSKFPRGKPYLVESLSKQQSGDWPEGLGLLKDWLIMLMQTKADQMGITDENLSLMYIYNFGNGSESDYGVLVRWYPEGKTTPVTMKMPFDLVRTNLGYKATVETFFND
jgi:hypothetical protein